MTLLWQDGKKETKKATNDSAWHMYGMHIRCSFLSTVYLHNQKQQVLSVATVLSPAEDMAWISWYQWYQSSQVNSLSVCMCTCTHVCVQALHVVPTACCMLSCCYGIHLSCTTSCAIFEPLPLGLPKCLLIKVLNTMCVPWVGALIQQDVTADPECIRNLSPQLHAQKIVAYTLGNNHMKEWIAMLYQT